jgi:hypothetical protein
MNILDHFSESLETVFRVKILKFFDTDSDPGSCIFLTVDPESRSTGSNMSDADVS